MIDKNDVKNLYEKNLSQKEISKILNVSQSYISRVINQFGLKRDKSILNLNKVYIDINYFKNIDSGEKSYWLGFICADGNINKNNNKMTLTSKDLEVIEKFKKCVKSGHQISYYEYLDKRTNKIYERYAIQVTTKPFTTNLINLGVTNKKTNSLNFPNIKEKFYPNFIAGLFDGDGSICYRKRNNQLLISLISTLEILNFIQDYIRLNFGIKKTKCQIVTNKKNNVYKMLLYEKNDVLSFLNFIYGDINLKNIYLQRKYNIYKKEIENYE